jgi:hypothetical protein
MVWIADLSQLTGNKKRADWVYFHEFFFYCLNDRYSKYLCLNNKSLQYIWRQKELWDFIFDLEVTWKRYCDPVLILTVTIFFPLVTLCVCLKSLSVSSVAILVNPNQDKYYWRFITYFKLLLRFYIYEEKKIVCSAKGIVQQKLRWVNSGAKRQVLL